jgi:beta-glucosidase
MPDSFPASFTFGTATAAYQIEGAVSEGGRSPSIWDTFSHRAGAVLHGDNGDVTCDHYHRMDEDVRLLGELGVSSYRFSISWPRVQPTGSGELNHTGLDFYKRLLDRLAEQQIAATVTLHHWDLPQVLEDAGGWRERETAARFAEYAGLVASQLNDRVAQWITLNEPWGSAWLGYGSGEHAPGVRDLVAATQATHHLLLAHGEAVLALRAAGAGSIGIALNPFVARPASEASEDVAAARRVETHRNELWLDPIFSARYPTELAQHYARYWPGLAEASEADLATIASPIDFLGVNYYSSVVVEASRQTPAVGDVFADLGAREVRPHVGEATPIGWRTDPRAFTELLVELASRYGCPVYVTENGFASHDYQGPDGAVHDPERIRYLDAHLEAVLSAIARGADVRGYYHWTLLDNFEWAYGFSMRYGLVYLDYPSQRRVPKDSFYAYQGRIAANRLLNTA